MFADARDAMKHFNRKKTVQGPLIFTTVLVHPFLLHSLLSC